MNVIKPVYVAVRGATIRALERRAGISTTGIITPEELGFSSQYRVRYQPSHWRTLYRMLPRDAVGADDVFVDFGCGMGRVMYQAAERYPFRRVEGVELSRELLAIADANIERNRPRLRCQDVRLVESDALEYEIPDDVTVAFFFNPFQGPIFEHVVDRLVKSVQAHPRPLRLIYLNPVEEPILLRAGFRKVRHLSGLRPGREWRRSNAACMYELTVGPAGASADRRVEHPESAPTR